VLRLVTKTLSAFVYCKVDRISAIAPQTVNNFSSVEYQKRRSEMLALTGRKWYNQPIRQSPKLSFGSPPH